MTPLVLLALILSPPDGPIALERIGTLSHEPIREASGLVRSRQFPGVYWVHNDSGNPPALFAVKRDGTLIREYRVNVANVDWEDIATDNDGHLYIGEIGNNDGRLPLRAIYQVDEPDPSKAGEILLRLKKASYYRFPPRGTFDAEALMVDGDRALIVAKTFDGRDAEIFSIPLKPHAPLLNPALPEKVATLPGFTRPATGADLSSDGRTLVVCSVDALGVFEKGKDGRWTALLLRPFRSDDQIEAVAWDGRDILLAGESRAMFRVPESTWRKPAERHD
jgi:hypothetical protein